MQLIQRICVALQDCFDGRRDNLQKRGLQLGGNFSLISNILKPLMLLTLFPFSTMLIKFYANFIYSQLSLLRLS